MSGYYKGQRVRIKGLPLFNTDPNPGTLANVIGFYKDFVRVRFVGGEAAYLPDELEPAQ